jgi:hypothetical protein
MSGSLLPSGIDVRLPSSAWQTPDTEECAGEYTVRRVDQLGLGEGGSAAAVDDRADGADPAGFHRDPAQELHVEVK